MTTATVDNIPHVYLSTSGGEWRLIYCGQPVCADTTRERAYIVALKFGYKNPQFLPIWDGDAGRFT